MPKSYDNQSPYDPKTTRLIKLGLWSPTLSDTVIDQLYEVSFDPNTPHIVIQYLLANISLRGRSEDISIKPKDRSQI